MEAFVGGAQAAVDEAFFDGLDVGAAAEEPGGGGVAQVVEADGVSELRGGVAGVQMWWRTSCGGCGRR
ncbi:MAG: hypothetical protein ABI775_01015 [Pseudonocardiales bacterium]